jgi:hypothetical protein
MENPFEASFEDVQANPDRYVSSVFASLVSEFLVLPKGAGFIEYPTFEAAYEALKQVTSGFQDIQPDKVMEIAVRHPISLIVLRAMLGFTPPEWAYVATQRTGTEISQGFVRSLDRKARMNATTALRQDGLTFDRLKVLVQVACELLNAGAPVTDQQKLHRLDKADTKFGAKSIESVASLGAPYAMLLYERFIGRPFAGHRDSVSELVGDGLETVIEDELVKAGVSYRKTKRAERLPGFDQAPFYYSERIQSAGHHRSEAY